MANGGPLVGSSPMIALSPLARRFQPRIPHLRSVAQRCCLYLTQRIGVVDCFGRVIPSPSKRALMSDSSIGRVPLIGPLHFARWAATVSASSVRTEWFDAPEALVDCTWFGRGTPRSGG